MIHSYSKNITGKKIAIIGVTPPPLGGVSVHINRVSHIFEQQQNEVFHFDPTKQQNFFLNFLNLIFFLLKGRYDIIYYHALDLHRTLSHFFLLCFFKYLIGYRLAVVEHNCRYLYTKSILFLTWFNFLIKKTDYLILIGNSTYQSYKDRRIKFPRNWTVESAFLPPILTDENKILSSYPHSAYKFIETHAPIIMANAFALSLLDGKDLYGFDLCIQVIEKLKETHPSVGLIFVVAAIENETYYKRIMQEIKTKNIHSHIYILTGQKELWPLFKHTNVFVRPTLSDAASVSIEEALYFKVPVIASNVCKRPEGVITFESRNLNDFYNKICSVTSKFKYAKNNNQRDYLHTQ